MRSFATLAILQLSLLAHGDPVQNTAQKVGQMTQLDISVVWDPQKQAINEENVASWLKDTKAGSFLNSPFAIYDNKNTKVGWDPLEWRTVLNQLQNAAFNEGIRPILYGIDSIHGATYVKGSVIFPQQLTQAAAFCPKMAEEVGRRTARATLKAGIPWIFSPVVGVMSEPRWARVFETYGEDPMLVGDLASAYVRGVQGYRAPEDSFNGPKRVAACVKHFIGYSHPTGGHDRAPVHLDRPTLYRIYFPPFQRALKESLTVMEAYHEIGRIPLAVNEDLLRYLLRGRMQFDGMMVTDYREIQNAEIWHQSASTYEEAIVTSMQKTTIDMSMVPDNKDFFNTLFNAVAKGTVPESRVDASAERITTLKDTLGLSWEKMGGVQHDDVNPNAAALDFYATDRSTDILTEFQSEATEDAEFAIDLIQKTTVLLKNSVPPSLQGTEAAARALPLPAVIDARKPKLLLAGPTCNSLAAQTGGWSVHWQGPTEGDAEIVDGAAGGAATDSWKHVSASTLLEGFRDLQADVTYCSGVGFDGTPASDCPDGLAAGHDAAVVCLGEATYTEKPGDINDIALNRGQQAFLKDVRDSTTKALILVYFGGRPRILDEETRDLADAIVFAGLPGPTGGLPIAKLLLETAEAGAPGTAGVVSPSGRLPFTWHAYEANTQPYWSEPSQQCSDAVDGSLGHAPAYSNGRCPEWFAFGTGMGYATMEYANLSVSPPDWASAEAEKALREADFDSEHLITLVEISVGWAANQLDHAALLDGVRHVLLLFAFRQASYVVPEYKRLASYLSIESVEKAQATTLTLNISASALASLAEDGMHDIIEPGSVFHIGAGPHVDCRADETSSPSIGFESSVDASWDHSNCAELSVPSTIFSDPICSYACEQWDLTRPPSRNLVGCDPKDSWQHMDFDSCISTCQKASRPWTWDYVQCLEKARTDGVCTFADRCWNNYHTTKERSLVSPRYRTATIALSVTIGVLGFLLVISKHVVQKLRRELGRFREVPQEEEVENLLVEDAVLEDPEAELELRQRPR